MRDRVEFVDHRRVVGGEDAEAFTGRVDIERAALAVERDVVAAGLSGRDRKRPALPGGCQGLCACRAFEREGVMGPPRFDVEATNRVAMQAPAVTARPRVGGLERALRGQRMRHDTGRCPLDRQRSRIEQRGPFALDQRGVEIGLCERGARGGAPQEGDVGVQPDDVGGGERSIEPGECLGAVGTPDDQLGDHRVVVGQHGVAFAHARVHPDVAALETSGALRRAVNLEPAGGRQEVGIGVLSADACLDRMAVDAQFMLLKRQRLARRHPQLPLDKIEPGDRLGDRVLDLQPRVHLHEEELQVIDRGTVV